MGFALRQRVEANAIKVRRLKRKSDWFWRAGFLPEWRAAADEDGHYCFAVAL
jgi:hypothetical protein